MKRMSIVIAMLAVLPAAMQAQSDDMYFVPKKSKVAPAPRRHAVDEAPAYYIGSNRDVDEYNRRARFRSSYQRIANDSTSTDVIDFQGGSGIYPDSTYVDSTTVYSRPGYDGSDVCYSDDDYRYCRRMQMFDGWYDPFFYGYYAYGMPYYWRTRWGGWYDPWLCGYAGWYGPWDYGWYGYGWPYYSSYYWGGWGYPHYWGAPAVAYRRGHTGTLGYYDRSNYAGGVRRPGRGSGVYYGGSGSSAYRGTNPNTTFGTRRSPSSSSFGNNGNNTFGTVRYQQPSTPSSSSFGGGRGGGSFGGGRGGAVGGGGGGARFGRR